MDAVIKYLPSPFERPPVTAKHVEGGTSVVRNPDKKDKLCGLAFKVVNDFQKGPIVFMRIYSGTLSGKLTLWNATREVLEKPSAILRVRANNYASKIEVVFAFVSAS